MTRVIVRKIDETNMNISCDTDGVLQEMSEFFSFYVPGFQYQNKFRLKLWDGKIRLIQAGRKIAPVGLFGQIAKFCADRGYQLDDITEPELKHDKPDLNEVKEWLKTLNLPFAPRDYQLKAFLYAISNYRGVLLSPTGCHNKDTRIVMLDGTTKKVQDIQVGDQLLGPDSLPRTVLKTITGTGPMYNIIPEHANSFSVNNEHVLHLYNMDNHKFEDIEVDQLAFDNIDHYRLVVGKDYRDYQRFDIIKKQFRETYYGFQLDKDHLYFTDNWVINHNSGKSYIQYLIIRWLHHLGKKVIMMVPSTSLVEQMISDFKDYAKNDKTFDVDKEVHGLYSKIKTTDPYKDQIVVSTWQSISKYDEALFETWDAVICDESHRASASILTAILGKSKNAVWKIGLTGTLNGSVCHEMQLTALFGSVFQVTTTKTLQDKDQLNKSKIYMILVKYPDDECKKVWNDVKKLKKTYADEVEYVNTHVKRNLFIRNLAISCKGTTLVLFKIREHGKLLYDLIKEKVGDSRPVYHIDGTVDTTTREAIRHDCDSEKDAILVASVNTTSTGINIKKLENLILCPGKSKIQTLQSIGRVLRICDGKDTSKIFDIVDDLSTGRHNNYLMKFALSRYEIYAEQGFDVEYKTVKM